MQLFALAGPSAAADQNRLQITPSAETAFYVQKDQWIRIPTAAQ